ncbi:MAG: hypothetical protein ACLRMJ_07490 [Alistipes finegoldii]
MSQGDNFQARATYQSVADGYSPADDGIVAEAKNGSQTELMRAYCLPPRCWRLQRERAGGKTGEVTKAYSSVESAAAGRRARYDRHGEDAAEIDYTITPLSLQTTLATRPIRPATVTY